MTTTDKVLAEVAAERARQDAKWGEQNHPLVDQTLVLTKRDSLRFAEEYEIPTATRARALCQIAARRGDVTWLHILIEEVSEFMEAAPSEVFDVAEARAEMLQVAAVAVAAIECIDRRAVES
jgi:hypothetical protein